MVRLYLFLEDDVGKKLTKKDKKKKKAEKEKEKDKDKTEKETTTKKPSKMVKHFTLFKNYIGIISLNNFLWSYSLIG